MITSKVTGRSENGVPEVKYMIKGKSRDIAVEFETILRALCRSELLPVAIAVIDKLANTSPEDIINSATPVDDIDSFLEKLVNKRRKDK